MIEKLSPSPHFDRRAHWVALGLCLLALVGYLYHLDAWRMNDDEGEYLYQFWRMTEGEMPYRDFLTPQLPVFLYTGALWMKLVGHNLFLLRILPVLLAFATGGLIFGLGKRFGNSPLALMGMLIYLLHPEVYRQSRFFRNEALFLFFGVLGLYLMVESMSHRQRWMLALSGVSFALATLCKFFGVFYVGGVALFFAWHWVSRDQTWREALYDSLTLVLPYGLIVGAVFAGFYLVIPIFPQAVLGHHLMQGQGLSRWEVFLKGLRFLTEYASMYPLLVGIALAASIGDSLKARRWTFIICQIPTVLVFLVLSRNFGPRHLLYLVPSLALLSALGIHTVVGKLGRWGWLAGIVLLSVLTAPWIRADLMRAHQSEDDTMCIARIIQENSTADDVVLGDFPGLNFFAQRRSTYLGAALSIGAASSGQITGAELIQEIVDDRVRVIVIDVQSFARHLSHMPDFATFYRYVRANFDLLGEFRREDQVLEIYHATHPPTSTDDPLYIAHVQVADLDGQVALLGYDMDRTVIHPDETLKLVLYWQAQTRMETDWSVFTHLLGPDGKVWGQMDQLPLKGLFPTSKWGKGEIVDDEYTILVAPDAPPGAYHLEVGMYNWMTGERLPVFDADGQRITGDQILLNPIITVLPNQ